MKPANILSNLRGKLPSKAMAVQMSMHAAAMGLGTYFGYEMYGRKYGAGVAIGYGVASALPWVGGAIMAAELGVSALEGGQQYYKERARRARFGAALADPWQIQAQQRLRALEKIGRGRSSLGSEARSTHF